MMAAPVVSLTKRELDLEHQALTKLPVALREQVRAWVRYLEPIEVDATIVAHTPRALAIVWAAPNGEHRAWVWRGAVG